MYNIKPILVNDEIRIGINCVKKGLKEFSEFGPTTIDLFIPMLLLSVGFERILKILFCLDYFNKNGHYPDFKQLKKISHDLEALLKYFLETCKSNELYSKASARISDLEFLEKNEDFIELFKILNKFGISLRYYNLNMITGNKNDIEDFRELTSQFLNKIVNRYPEVINVICNPPYNTQIVYDIFNPYFIGLVQRFMRVLSYGFTQGAFGDEARNLSAGLINDFLLIRDEDISKINFK